MTSQERNPAATTAAAAAVVLNNNNNNGAVSAVENDVITSKGEPVGQAGPARKTQVYVEPTSLAKPSVLCVAEQTLDKMHQFKAHNTQNDNENDGNNDIATKYTSAHVEEAEKLYAKAEASVANGLSGCIDWIRARDLFHEAGALFAACGYADAAAKAFLHAGVITQAFKSETETILMLSLAADNLQVVQPAIAVDVLNFLSDAFAKSGLTIQAARCKRDAAELLDYRLEMPVQAVQTYREAIQLFGDRTVTKSFTRGCMERISALTVLQLKFVEASELYMEESKMVQRFIPKTRQFLYSLLCLLANGFGGDDRYFDALYYTRKKFDALQEEERHFQQGKEYTLMRQLIDANDHGSLNEFDIAVFKYKSCATFKPDIIFDILIERCRSNLYEHMEQYM
ncbi:hypothetical protein MOQ_003925 [Trypanosoma cruzi marinkellei]|uniref:Uncharacterized protein n=1 Tax=Trypanosoma cruzi marinkellei TaxID=85056 RepID=K2MAQ9_TRYCR|nr:hypothetical protein MOQ_003925 [Trypanosoma cruzi marinkellei]